MRAVRDINWLQILMALVACAAVLWPAHVAPAADVQVAVSPRETSVGVPVTLTINIINAQDFQTPQLPEIEGAALQPSPGRRESTSTSIINGRVTTTRTITLTYRVVPYQEGTITIPGFDVMADGTTFSSQPIEIVVNKADGGGLLFASVRAEPSSLYLGQPLKLTLQIWIRPYQDRNFNLTLSASDMWSLVDIGASSWGDFAQTLAQVRDPFGGMRVQAHEVLRDDGAGSRRSYYLYELTTTIWPQAAGTLALDQPHIVMKYPLRLSREDAFFPTGRLAIAEARALSVVADPPVIVVKPPPLQHQPPGFNGAVGQFDFTVTAQPVDVAVGDPITLTMKVTDRSGGQTQLDLVPPPPLDRVPELMRNFRMPSDPLAGTVSGSTKTFTQTIRARSAQVDRIPPITFAYFDPAREEYITLESQPIALRVSGSSQVDPDTIVQSQQATSEPRTAMLTETTGGILANQANIELMLRSHRFEFGWREAALLGAPLAAFGMLAASRLALRSRRGDEGLRRRRGARRRAFDRIQSARKAERREQAQTIIAAISDYVADRTGLPQGTLTTADVARLLDDRTGADLRQSIIQLLQECEQLAYGGGGLMTSSDLTRTAMDCIHRLERSNLR